LQIPHGDTPPYKPNFRFDDPDGVFTIATDLSSKALSHLKTTAGVYVLLDANGWVLYVGQSVHLGTRIRQQTYAGNNYMLLAAVAYRECQDLTEVEMALLWKYLPPYNGSYSPNTTFAPLKQFVDTIYTRMAEIPFSDRIYQKIFNVPQCDTRTVYRILHQSKLPIVKHHGCYCDCQLIKLSEANAWLDTLLEKMRAYGWNSNGAATLTALFLLHITPAIEPCALWDELAPLIEYRCANDKAVVLEKNYRAACAILDKAGYEVKMQGGILYP